MHLSNFGNMSRYVCTYPGRDMCMLPSIRVGLNLLEETMGIPE